ncbi:hypothetical protein RB595_005474 [Gaeumannomyces hyphopodioides]
MQLSSVLTVLMAATALALPQQRNRGNGRGKATAPDGTITNDAEKFAGGRKVTPGAQCVVVQGRKVCDDGTGNTFFADEPFRA